MLYKLYQKQVEAWKERFISQRNDGVPVVFKVGEKVDDLLFSNHKDTIELIEAEIERKKGMRRTEKTVHTPNCQRGTCKNNHFFCSFSEEDIGYNSAIDEDIAYLEEQLKLIKKEI